jgi:hypothetical protein
LRHIAAVDPNQRAIETDPGLEQGSQLLDSHLP